MASGDHVCRVTSGSSRLECAGADCVITRKNDLDAMMLSVL